MAPAACLARQWIKGGTPATVVLATLQMLHLTPEDIPPCFHAVSSDENWKT